VLAACLLAGAWPFGFAWAQPGGQPSAIVPPAVVHQHEAVYPEAERAANRQVQVVLLVTVDDAGHVTKIDVAESGGQAFDEAAIVAMREWLFTPATKGGVRMAARIRVPVVFSPRSQEPPAAVEVAPRPSAPAPEDPAPAPPPTPSPAPLPETVYAHGRAHIPSRGAGDHEIVIGKLASVPRMDAASLLRLAPGVMMTNAGGLGHPYQIFLRGFDAREGQDIEFTLDGTPINEVGNVHGNGLADTHFIIPELVHRLRIIEGPFAPQQGNFAVAGSALYDVGIERPGLTLSGMAGSFGTKRVVALWRPENSSDHTFGGGELFSSNGFGDNRAADRASAMAGYEGNLGPSGRYRFLATSYATHYAQAGVLRLDDVESGRKDFYGTNDTSQGGDSTRHSLTGNLDAKVGTSKLAVSTFMILRDFRLRQNFTGFQNDPQQSYQSPHTQRGDLIDQQSQTLTVGSRGSLRETLEVLGRKQELEVGYFARYDKVDSRQRRNRSQSIVPYRTDLNLASGIANVGLYTDLSIKPVPWITVRGGVRGDLFHYRVENACAQTSKASLGAEPLDTECFASDRQGYRSPGQTVSTAATLFQPRAVLLVGPFSGMTLSLAHGVGARSLDPQYINQDLDAPFAKAISSEAGVTLEKSMGDIDLSARSTFFRTSVDKDLFFNQTEGRSTLSTGTTRVGWAGNARATGRFFDVAASLTFVRATFDDTQLLIPYVPAGVFRLDASVFHDLPWKLLDRSVQATLSSGVSYVGSRPLPLGERSSNIFLTDLSASLAWREFSLGVVSTNLFGSKYKLGEYNYPSDFRSQSYPTLVSARHFTAGEPRAVYATFSVTLFGGNKP
jgi:iron complex outermembrane recepter protein